MKSLESRIAAAQGIGGESYSEKGRRNPIRRDTNEVLTALVLAKSPRLIVEVGTGYGTSTFCMAQALNGGRIVTFELSNSVAEEVQANLDADGINAKVIPGLFPGSFDPEAQGISSVDMLFLDGEKGAYLEHLKAVEPYLAPNAVILADNTIDRQEECQPFLDYVADNYNVVTIPTECGLTVATR